MPVPHFLSLFYVDLRMAVLWLSILLPASHGVLTRFDIGDVQYDISTNPYLSGVDRYWKNRAKISEFRERACSPIKDVAKDAVTPGTKTYARQQHLDSLIPDHVQGV